MLLNPAITPVILKAFAIKPLFTYHGLVLIITQVCFLNFIPVIPIIRIMGLLSGPQDLPASVSLLSRLLMLYLVTGMMVLLPGSEDLFTAVALMLMDLILLVGFLSFCLYTRNTSARFLQTFIACLGVGVVFQIIALPLVVVLNTAAESNQANNAIGGLFYLLLVGWQVTVMAHILRHAMNMMLSLTLMLSFSYMLLIIFLSNQLVALLNSGS